MRGDEIDRILAEEINKYDTILSLRREKQGVYYFGQKKLIAYLKNGNLVIKTGGGNMTLG